MTGLTKLDVDDPDAGIAAYRLEGKASTEQAQEVFDRVEAAAAAGKKLRLYYELEGFPSAEAGVFFEKLKHVGAILRTIERAAYVGDQGWLKVIAQVFDPITKMEMRHFSMDQKEAALAWLREPTQP